MATAAMGLPPMVYAAMSRGRGGGGSSEGGRGGRSRGRGGGGGRGCGRGGGGGGGSKTGGHMRRTGAQKLPPHVLAAVEEKARLRRLDEQAHFWNEVEAAQTGVGGEVGTFISFYWYWHVILFLQSQHQLMAASMMVHM
jgi:hypothetical protein